MPLDKTLASLVNSAAGSDETQSTATQTIPLASLDEEALDVLTHTSSLVAEAIPGFDLLAAMDLVRVTADGKLGAAVVTKHAPTAAAASTGAELLDLAFPTLAQDPAALVTLRGERVVVPSTYVRVEGGGEWGGGGGCTPSFPPPPPPPPRLHPRYLEHDGCAHEGASDPGIGAAASGRRREARLATAVIDALSRGDGKLAALQKQRLISSLAAQADGLADHVCAEWSGHEGAAATLAALATRERVLQASVQECEGRLVRAEQEHLLRVSQGRELRHRPPLTVTPPDSQIQELDRRVRG